MFEHLLQEFTPPIMPNPLHGFMALDRTAPMDLLEAQVGTADWLKTLGAPDEEEILSGQAEHDARAAFVAAVTNQSPDEQRKALMQNRVPAAVRRITAMLSAYDWEFVEQAKELRGYTVAKIFEMTQHPDPRHALRALEMMGKVTEVGLFTERIEMTKIDMTDEALEAKIKSKLDKFRHVIDITNTIDQVPEPTTLQDEVSTN